MRSVRWTIGIFACLSILLASINQVDTILSPEETGEVAIRRTEVTTGYDTKLLANQHAFVDGWFWTRNQTTLLVHPVVKQTVTFAMPHARPGENVAAVGWYDNVPAEVEGPSDEDAKRLLISKAWQHTTCQGTHVTLGRWQHTMRQNIHVILGRKRE